jgi:tripartite-type tricarboxylate transporter receptor subunit TctC
MRWRHGRARASRSTTGIAVTMLLMALPACAPAPLSGSENYPQREVRFVLPYSAGGPSDLGARALMACFEREFGTAWVVENQPGGAGAPAMVEVATAGPAGYTLGLGTQSTLVTTPTLEESVGYTYRDFSYAGQTMEIPSLILVAPDSPYRTIGQLLDAVRAAPETISLGTSGAQTSFSLATTQLAARGVVFNHVPFEGSSEANAAFLGGNIEVRWDAAAQGTLEYIESGRMRPLATGASERLSVLPDVPTLAEAGVEDLIDTSTFYGFIGPRDLDPRVLERVRETVRTCVSDPAYGAAIGEQYAVYAPADALVERLGRYQRTVAGLVGDA